MEREAYEHIRQKAEDLLESIGHKRKEEMSDMEVLLHELSVIQTELEIQNDELKKTQLDLERSRNRFAELYDRSPAGHLTIDENEMIIEANLRSGEMFELTRKSLIGTTITKFVQPEEQDRFYLQFRKLWTNRMPHVFQLGMCTASGTRFIVRLDGILDESYGLSPVIRCSLIDITEQSNFERALQEAHNKYRDLMNTIDGAVWESLDADHSFTFVSSQSFNIFGAPPPVCTGEKTFWSSHLHPDDRATTMAFIGEEFKEGHSYYLEYRFKKNDTEFVWLRDHVAIGRDDNNRLYMRGITVDITEQKQYESALLQTQKTESLGVLAGGIAHDFNNLLQAILGQSSLAMNKVPPGHAAASNIEKAIRSAERAADLTRQLLAYAGKGKLLVKIIDPNTIINETIRILETLIRKNIVILKDLSPERLRVKADLGQIQQVVMNLLINASEAIGDAAGTIQISTGVVDVTEEATSQWTCGKTGVHPGRYVLIRVADTGCGISEETLAKIFDPFYSTKFTGRGLGLAAVLGIMRGHSGGVNVASTVGKGTTFQVIFPEALDPVVAERESISTLGTLAESILMIDDDDGIREAFSDAMTHSGIPPLVAPDGMSGIAMYQKHRDQIKAIVLDLSMPGMGGLETFNQLRAINPDVKVILSSGYSEYEATGKFQGLTGFIQKPYTWNQLAELLRSIHSS